MFDFEEALRLVSKQTVLCVGDVMLDDFVYGEVTRISPEAPTPVLAVKHNTIEIGGAGNVARNIAALGATCIFVGLVGDDEAGLTLRKALAIPELVIDKTRPTTRKVRFVSEHQTFGRQRRKQMVRVARIRENAYNVGTGSAAAIAPIIE